MINNEIIKIASNTSYVGLKNNYTYKSSKKNSMCGDLIKVELVVKKSKIKIARTHLFYLSLILFKKNELSEASKKLKEAIAITDMDFQAFVNSEPYKDEKNIKKLIEDFHSIESY